jgi:hypothetical protein
MYVAARCGYGVPSEYECTAARGLIVVALQMPDHACSLRYIGPSPACGEIHACFRADACIMVQTSEFQTLPFQNGDLEGYTGLLVIYTVEVSAEFYNINYFVTSDLIIT